MSDLCVLGAVGASAGAVRALGDHRGLQGWDVLEPRDAVAKLLNENPRPHEACELTKTPLPRTRVYALVSSGE